MTNDIKTFPRSLVRAGISALLGVLLILEFLVGEPLQLIAIVAVIVGWFGYEKVVYGLTVPRYVKWYVPSLVVWFVAFDVVLAQFYVSFSPFRIPHRFYHHGISPSSRMNDPWGNLNAEVLTNDWGMKDLKIRKVARKFDGYRILSLGDSFTEGQG